MLTKKNSAFSRNIHTPFTLDSISYTSMEKNKKGKKKKKKKKYLLSFSEEIYKKIKKTLIIRYSFFRKIKNSRLLIS